jgi:hypothetical protein
VSNKASHRQDTGYHTPQPNGKKPIKVPPPTLIIRELKKGLGHQRIPPKNLKKSSRHQKVLGQKQGKAKTTTAGTNHQERGINHHTRTS